MWRGQLQGIITLKAFYLSAQGSPRMRRILGWRRQKNTTLKGLNQY
jgi:hypothetical protein